MSDTINVGSIDDIGDDTKRMAMICWSSDLDRVWPVLILATTAAASGMQVDVFFTFWGATTSGSPASAGSRRWSRWSTGAARIT